MREQSASIALHAQRLRAGGAAGEQAAAPARYLQRSSVRTARRHAAKAYTCWYWDGSNHLVEADIRFKRGSIWIDTTTVPAGCTNELHLESVATHEARERVRAPAPEMQAGGPCDANVRASATCLDRWMFGVRCGHARQATSSLSKI